MERNVDMTEISDGKRYTSNDLAKLGCADCAGCSKCCHGMGESITLDPYDIYNLTINLKMTFNELLAESLGLSVKDMIILPHLNLKAEGEGCLFLDENGRCSIHSFRPGICRLFPLGRIYENESFSYFLQINECAKQNRTKVKIKKWLGIPNLAAYENYINTWHYFLKNMKAFLEEQDNEEMSKKINVYILKIFFEESYNNEDFYTQFEKRMQKMQQIF